MRAFIAVVAAFLTGCSWYSHEDFARLCAREAKIFVLDESVWPEFVAAVQRAKQKAAAESDRLRLQHIEGFSSYSDFYVDSSIAPENGPFRDDVTLTKDGKVFAILRNYQFTAPGFAARKSGSCVLDHVGLYRLDKYERVPTWWKGEQ